jgi:methionyl-tRNA formyltransferase
MNKKVVVISPNPESYFTTSVCELLLRRNITIQSVIVKRFTIKRFKDEFSRDGLRLVKKIWKKLILKRNAYEQTNFENIISFRSKLNINLKNVNELVKSNTEIINIDDINSNVVKNLLIRLKPDLVVFTGGGLIKENILNVSGKGVVNCHMGILPMYRGMDVIEWPILHEDWNNIGVTIHFMKRGVDTGDVLKKYHISLSSDEDIKKLRLRFEPIMVEQLVNTVDDFLNKKIKPKKQIIEDGKQFFVMSKRLVDVAEKKLSNHQNTH